MSRIHEALKKAEQERVATPLVSDPNQPLASLSAGEATLAPGLMSAPEEMGAGAETIQHLTGDYIRFEDLRARCSHPEWHPAPNENVFSPLGLDPLAAEQFRTLRSRLYQFQSNQKIRTLLVTSSIPREGKTFVASNLAQAIVCQPDHRVLLIDADLRCSRLHVPLGAPSSPGLTDYLSGKADEMAVIQQGPEGNLCFIPGGNSVTNPSELLSNGGIRKLLTRLAPVFDWVIVDSPPCMPVADASVLADICDGVLFVVRAGSTPSAVAHKACQELQGGTVAGVVLNGVEEVGAYGSYYYYGDGGGRDESKKSRK
ncbi:MAG: CpsD/CapB family tyrosine-protein kinase [Candidatus Acidiferrales bacterium]